MKYDKMEGWVESSSSLAVANKTSIDGEIIGWIVPFGSECQHEDGYEDFVTFDGSDWRDRGSRTITVTHWKR